MTAYARFFFGLALIFAVLAGGIVLVSSVYTVDIAPADEPGLLLTPRPSPQARPTALPPDAVPVGNFAVIEVEYPLWLAAGSSTSIAAIVRVVETPFEPVTSFARIDLPSDQRPQVRQMRRYRAVIPVADVVSLELTGPQFGIAAAQNAAQRVDIFNANRSSLWVWTVAAPSNTGTSALTLRAEAGTNPDSSWVRTFSLGILPANADPGGSSPSLWQRFAEEPVAVFSALLSFIAAIAGVVVTYLENRKPQAKKR